MSLTACHWFSVWVKSFGFKLCPYVVVLTSSSPHLHSTTVVISRRGIPPIFHDRGNCGHRYRGNVGTCSFVPLVFMLYNWLSAILLLEGLILSFPSLSITHAINLMVSLSPTTLKLHCIFFPLSGICASFTFLSLFLSFPHSLSPSGSWAGSLLASRHLIGWVSLLFNTLISHSALLHCSGAKAQLHCPFCHQMLDGYKECVKY